MRIVGRTFILAAFWAFTVASAHAAETYDAWFALASDTTGAPVTSIDCETGSTIELALWASTDRPVNAFEARWALGDNLPLDVASISFNTPIGGDDPMMKGLSSDPEAGYAQVGTIGWWSSVKNYEDPYTKHIFQPTSENVWTNFKVFTFQFQSNLAAGQSSMVSLIDRGTGNYDTTFFNYDVYGGGIVKNEYITVRPGQYDVRINSVPEPGSLAGMAAAGVGVIVPWLRRRTRFSTSPHRGGKE